MELRRRGGIVWIELEGDISFYNAGIIKQRILNALKPEDKTAIMNLSKVNFMDSAGLSVIISLFKHMKDLGGSLELEYPKLGVQKFLEMTRLDQLIEIKKTKEPTTGSWEEVSKGKVYKTKNK